MLSLHKIIHIEKKPPELPEKKNKKTIIVISVVLLVLFFSGKFWYDSNNKKTVKKITTLSFQEKSAVLGENDVSAAEEDLMASSENFSVAQINLNDGIGSDMTDFEQNPLLEISDIKSELYSIKDGDKNEVKAIISCKTSKKAFIEIEYFKSGEKTGRTIKDLYSGFTHTLTISVDIDSVYKYSIKATDVFGNEAKSEQLVFYTGAPNISLIDTLENAFRKVFGWALGG
ncbi:MAG TPA: hypothetical protein DCS28_00590 [Candidatus Moranbacteria bacterium]|nr:hypothetical protein [Candidatus Moranbacteria bacterium]HAT74528.1 hypothetical protein [Candidatus Moranbacteria bacterium]